MKTCKIGVLVQAIVFAAGREEGLMGAATCTGSACAFWRTRNNMWGWCGLAGAVGDDRDMFLNSAQEASDEIP